MTLIESEEVRFKRTGLSASDYDASLPIKKRRFPVVQFPPSPSKDLPSFHSDGNLLKAEQLSPPKVSSSNCNESLIKTEQPSSPKEPSSFNSNESLLKTKQPSPSKDLSSFNHNENLIKTEQPILSMSIVSSSSVVTSSALLNNDQNNVSEEKKGKSDTDSCCEDIVQSDIGTAGVKFQEPTLGGHDYISCFDEYEGKSLVTVKHTIRKSPEIYGGSNRSSTSLYSDPLAGNKEEGIDVKMPEENCSPPICEVGGGAGVSVGLNCHMDLKLVPEKSDLNFLKQNSVEPVLLDLSLNKHGSSTQCVKDNVGSDCDGPLLQLNREKWDLNTSMESWEGCTGGDSPVVQMSATQTNTTIETHACPSEMVESDSPCGKQTLLDGEDKGNSIYDCMPSKENLDLSLDSSYLKPVQPVLEEDPYISEYESDGNWDIAEAVDDDDNDNHLEEDYEDGEVRETLQESEVEVLAYEKREIEPLDHAGCDDKKINSIRLPDHELHALGPLEQETKPENLDLRSEDDVRTTTNSKSYEQENEDLCVKELHAVENTISGDVNKAVKVTGRGQLFQFDKKHNFEAQDTADEMVDEELIPTFSQGEVENAVAVDVVQNRDLTLPTVKESVNEDDAKDINGGTRNSRIINFNRASIDSTPCKEKSSFSRSVLSHKEREFVPNMAVEGANMQPQERDDAYSNITKKISIDKREGQPPLMGFSHRRGRSSNRLDHRSEEWDFGPNFSPETYSEQQIDYHVPGLDQNRYKITPDGPFGGANRRGRELLEDEEPFFFHGPSRRKSLGRRHGPNVGGGKMVYKIPRDFSPGRCMDEGGSFDRQHGEKFSRNFADDTVDLMYPRPQPPYDIDKPFFRERRNFSFQRKSFPRIDSKSPVRSRARSPGQWFSSKRSDRFCERSDMTHRRSPNYRSERMRSPDQRPIRGHMPPGRRQGFHFLSASDEMRDVGPAPDHGHMRSIIPDRNQTERLPLRNRSYDAIDPQGRIENDDFFYGPPVRLGQLTGYNDGVPDDDERRFNERHEPLYSFKHPFGDSDGERFRNNREDCSRPFRFCPGNDPRISWKRR
ncbi:uncharacterized protein LOC101204567 [Cucumis sativus]|uniref:Uncharacterized protein n=1 Tax=Cucumis sativus TaxID=3659 RepID=A0A0A0KNM2_CUCSA|nr:uncharacterized protein LOC101204567 [Cucumis sativus]XP_031741364.1 uncharacterized protein LOC101204567 [Cucumis sativus]XP_031741365.1 uncharacterized protein LOC101204567 [Cucumis sativus]XP_031741366.1 uncharacterized protein LOC101204567 [Cucumis sativus]